MKKFIARVKWEWCVTACDPALFKVYSENDTWYADTLQELQHIFWNTFHGHDVFHYNKLLTASITDVCSGNTWMVNDWGRKI